METLNKFPVDTVRFYTCYAATYGSDLNFSEEAMITMHNAELADVLGNLVHRVLNLAQKYCGGKVPDTIHDEKCGLPFDLNALKTGIAEDMKCCYINLALYKGMEAARATNRWLTEAEPWKMKGENEVRRSPVIRTALEAVYAFMHFLAPIIPLAADAVFNKFHTSPVISSKLKADFYNLTPDTPVTLGEILFQKIEQAGELPTDTAKGPAPKGAKGGKSGGKPAPAADVEDHEIDFTKVDIRVGQITKIWKHETAERLFCEEIDCGADIGLRQVCSGLRNHYVESDLLNRKVLVVCNLKESKFQGFMSYGMVLAGKGKQSDGSDIVQLVDVPEGSSIGDRIVPVGAHAIGTPYAPAKMKKMKVWEALAPGLKADSTGIVGWNDMKLAAFEPKAKRAEDGNGQFSLATLVDVQVS